MKIAPLYHALEKEAWADPVIVHTGQLYDINMSDAFFTDLDLPDPHIHLGIGSGSHAQQTGNIMIDSLEMVRQKITGANAFAEFGLAGGDYGLITLHRPSNVDSPEGLSKLCRMLIHSPKKTPFVFPVHPRTRKNLAAFGLMDMHQEAQRIILTEPMNYIRFMNFVFNCKFVITDSGGIQEETTYLGIPCLTMRPNTERPVTVGQGTKPLCTMENQQRHTPRRW